MILNRFANLQLIPGHLPALCVGFYPVYFAQSSLAQLESVARALRDGLIH
jgi:hypothetical protein